MWLDPEPVPCTLGNSNLMHLTAVGVNSQVKKTVTTCRPTSCLREVGSFASDFYSNVSNISREKELGLTVAASGAIDPEKQVS